MCVCVCVGGGVGRVTRDDSPIAVWSSGCSGVAMDKGIKDRYGSELAMQQQVGACVSE